MSHAFHFQTTYSMHFWPGVDKDNDIALRPTARDFLLPICNYELHRRSFVVRCLVNFLIV